MKFAKTFGRSSARHADNRKQHWNAIPQGCVPWRGVGSKGIAAGRTRAFDISLQHPASSAGGHRGFQIGLDRNT